MFSPHDFAEWMLAERELAAGTNASEDTDESGDWDYDFFDVLDEVEELVASQVGALRTEAASLKRWGCIE